MESVQVQRELPDMFGLPEYFISEVVTEIDGPNVRIVCGIKRGGQVHWLYSAVMRADQLMRAVGECGSAAEQAFNLNKLFGRRGH
jgi:hypothetical protein